MEVMRPPSFCTFTPLASCRVRVVQVTWLTAAMEASASPRNPRVAMAVRSWARVILLVA